MKGGAHPSPFAALSFPNSKKVPIFCWVDRESFPVAAWRSRASNFLHHSRAALTTRPRRLSRYACSVLKQYCHSALTSCFSFVQLHCDLIVSNRSDMTAMLLKSDVTSQVIDPAIENKAIQDYTLRVTL